MKHRSIISFCLLLFFAATATAQTSFFFHAGTSKADNSFGTLGVNHQLGNKFRLGLEFQGSDYRYRFIDARAVSDDFAGSIRLLFMGKVAENDRFRLDLFVKPGYRFVQAPDLEDFDTPPLYDFEDGHAITIDPGLLVNIKVSERFGLHTGLNMHMAFQTAPDFIFEQFPSSNVLAGASYALKRPWVLYANAMAGPNSGAAGDSEKFFWSTAFGVRFHLNMDRSEQLVSGF